MKNLHIKWQWTVPNVLSLMRIALIPVFAVLYLNSKANTALLAGAFAVLVVSGLTDLFDGWIARRFNQISEAGKLLDPLADKLTQLTVVICLATQFRELVWLMIFCLLKEVAQVVGGVLLLHQGDEVRSSQWFGKVCTVVFYTAMAAIVLFEDMSATLRIVLVVFVGVLMLATFLGYLFTYIGARKAFNPNKE